MRRLLGIIGLMVLMGLMGNAHAKPIQPIDPIQPIAATATTPPYAPDHADTTVFSWLSLDIDGQVFFIDNEYFGRRIEGYTLPGFRLTPKLIWSNGKHLTLEGGVSWLHYWGAHSYPNTMSYGVLPDYSDTSTWMHVVPWLQAKLQIAKGLELTLGSINPSENHLLPQPLRNIEREIAADPECGLMLDAWNDWGHANLWIDWREFIWNQSPRQERFTMGLSGKIFLDLPTTDFSISLPAHFIAQHVGGQVLAQTTPIQNNFNAATGLGINYYATDYWTIAMKCYAMLYHQHGNSAVPFTHGWGLYPELVAEYRNRAGLQLSYWRGERFVPLMGSWLYSNLSAVDGTTVFDRTEMLSLRAWYKWSPTDEPFCLHIEGSAHYDIGEQQAQYSVGCVLCFYPKFRLR